MDHLDTLLLLALPAAGKSEIRRYLRSVDAATALADFGLGPVVELDDYPYVRLMGLIDAAVAARGGVPPFFTAPNGLLREPRDWGSLAVLLAEDHAALGSPPRPEIHPTGALLARFDRARSAVGASPVTTGLDPGVAAAVAADLDREVGAFLAGLSRELARYEPSSTVIVEFARGGPEGSRPPLAAPHGYAYTLGHLGSEVLSRAAILYVWATAEESRRRNRERAGPETNPDDAVLHHVVPETVMRRDYGMDDLRWLVEQGNGSVAVAAAAGTFDVPAAVIDNRDDATSFLREDPSTWDPDAVAAIHGRLRAALGSLRGGRG